VILCYEGSYVQSNGYSVTYLAPETIVLPASLAAIKSEAFAGVNVQRVVIPDGCRTIGYRAFMNRSELIQIVIPSSVTSIAADAFSGCRNVRIIAPQGSIGHAFALAHASEGFSWQPE